MIYHRESRLYCSLLEDVDFWSACQKKVTGRCIWLYALSWLLYFISVFGLYLTVWSLLIRCILFGVLNEWGAQSARPPHIGPPSTSPPRIPPVSPRVHGSPPLLGLMELCLVSVSSHLHSDPQGTHQASGLCLPAQVLSLDFPAFQIPSASVA